MEKISTNSVDELKNPANCLDSSRIRAFLRLSRFATDDSLKPHLNDLRNNQCESYFSQTIAPEWVKRASLIQYCENYAESLRKEVQDNSSASPQKEFDLRTDPYALKTYQDHLKEKYSTIETIENWTRNELAIESILKEQTVDTFKEKCAYKDWFQVFKDLSK